MSAPVVVLGALICICILLAALVALRVELTRVRGGKILAFLAFFILPTLAIWAEFSRQVDHAETTQFCLSCHVMADYGRSLYVDDPSYIPAAHFQNNQVPRDHACYTCHTDYTMFGPVRSKLRGLRHLYIQYLGTVPKPEDIKLYTPYNNRECLHCHQGARTYEEATEHHKIPDMLAQVKSGKLSCISAKCHDTVHDIPDLKGATFWKPAS
ncbi:MAG TPA: NapC/NirT family cytochrome c [Terriglobia bacterium]|nr:NapC/NirT family cytochrome c [Terriglobia bacterium]